MRPMHSALVVAVFITLNASFRTFAQISGPTSGTVNVTYEYSYYSSQFLAGPNWQATGGTVMSTWESTGGSGGTYYANIKWTVAGDNRSVIFANFSEPQSTLAVDVCSSGQSAGVSISNPGTICLGSNVTFTATPTNGGSSPHYVWKVNTVTKQSGSSNTYSTTTLAQNDVVSVTMTSSISCLSPVSATASRTISSTISPGAVSVSIYDPGTQCQGAQITFTASPTNGGNSPTYEWYRNGYPAEGNIYSQWGDQYSPDASHPFLDDETIQVKITSNSTCYTGSLVQESNIVTLSIQSNTQPQVNIIGESGFCAGTPQTYTAWSLHTITSYSWNYDGGLPASTSSSYSISSEYLQSPGKTVNLTVGVSGSCLSSNTASATLPLTIFDPPQVGTLSAGTIVFCNSGSVTLNLTSHSGDNSWQYRYKDGTNGTFTGFSQFSVLSANTADFTSLSCGPSLPRYYEFRTVVSNGSCPVATSDSASVTVYPSPSVGTLSASNGPDFCSDGTLNLELSSYVGTLEWQYQEMDDGGSWSGWATFSSSASNTNTFNVTNNGSVPRYYRFKVSALHGNCIGAETPFPYLTASSVPVPGVPSPSTIGTTEPGQVTIYGGEGSNATTNKWYAADTEESLVHTGDQYQPTLSVTTDFWVSSYNEPVQCESSRVPVTAHVYPAIPLVHPSSAEVKMGAPVTLFVTNGQYATYKWWFNGNIIATNSSVDVSVPGSYKVEGTKTGMTGSRFSANVFIERAFDSQEPRHYVIVNHIRQDNVADAIQVEGLTVDQRSRTVTYIGGLGNSLQMISSAASPLRKNIIQTPKYDALGRQLVQYMPYVSGADDSKFRDYALDNAGYTNSEQYAFYQQTGIKIATDTIPYSTTEVEPSPLQRVTGQTGVGSAWYSAGKKVIKQYLLNRATDNIRLWKVVSGLPASSAAYTDYQLYVDITTDENGNMLKIYTDKNGRVVQKDVQSDTGTWLKTCNVYDDFGRLAYVLTPEGVRTMSGYSPTQDFLDSWAFQYRYDPYGRAVETKPPGAGWQYTVYDPLDRVVLTQSADQRTRDEWTFMKYDVYGRAVLVGYKGIEADRSTVQASVDAQLYNWEIVSSDAIGYTLDRTYPSATASDLLSVKYYDNYNFLAYSGWDAEAHSFTFVSELGTSATAPLVTGFPTGSKVRVVNSAAPSAIWLNEVQYYDTESRPVQVIAENHLGGLDRTTLKYSLRSQVDETLITHGGPETITVLRKTDYDHAGRIIKRYENINNAPADQLVAQYEYNELGQLVTKKLHKNGQNGDMVESDPMVGQPGVVYDENIVSSSYSSTGHILVATNSITLDPGFHVQAGDIFKARIGYSWEDAEAHNSAIQDFVQEIDYRYNIRGWLTSINNAQLDSDGGVTNDDTDDYFGMEMVYNTAESALGNTALFDGNISAMKWKGLGSVTGNDDRRSYKFAYDKADRLLTATSQMYSGSTWTKEANVKNESMTYDDNGNIKTLLRNQPKHQLQGVIASYISEPIDNLTFTYKASSGNQLDKVEDATGKAEGFSNGESGNGEFTYNADGSVSADDNKGIDTIYYNMLGKPWQIVFTDGRKLEYTYGASGQKLKMKFYEGGVVQDSIDYSGGFVYKNGALDFFASSEGRVVKNGSGFEYQYVISDHQGNTRVLFSSVTPAAESADTGFETDPGDVENFPTGGNLSTLPLFNNTENGTNSQLLNGGYNGQVGVGRSFAVFPGDTVRIEAYVKYEGSNASSPGAFASALLGAFDLPAPGPGESGTASAAMNTWGTLVDGGYQDEEHASAPSAYVNIIIFDRDFNFLDAAYQQVNTAAEQVGVSPDVDHEYLTKEYIIGEEGFVFMYVSNNSPVNVYFDDVTMTHSASNVIQYNEYYPFGLQTAGSWTRENASNRYLYNGGNELNENSGWYETFFREYDAVLGRFMQVDPLASAFGSHSPYHYAYNNPMLFNDVFGASADSTGYSGGYHGRIGPSSGNHWSNQYNSVTANYMMMSTGDFQSYYGLNDGYGGTNYTRAGELAQAMGGTVTDPTHIAQMFASGFNFSIGENYLEIPNYEVLYEEGNEVKMRALPSTWIALAPNAQQGCDTCPASGLEQDAYEKVLFTAGSGFIGIGGFATGIAEGQIADKAVRATAEGTKGVKLLGRGLTGFGIGIATYQLYAGDGNASDYARFGGSLVIAGTAAIPLVGKFVSLGLGIADAAGVFEEFYRSFDNPAMQVFYMNVLTSGGNPLLLRR